MVSIFGAARPIWGANSAQTNAYVNLRDSFQADPTRGPWLLRISADAQYVLFVNGQYVDGGQYADYPQYKVYDELDITPYIRSGANTLQIGGYCPITDSFTYRSNQAGIIFAVYGADGFACESSTRTLCAPDSCYRSGSVDRITSQLGYSFEHDARTPSILLDEAAIGFEPAIEVPMAETYYPRPVEKLRLLPRRSGRILSQGVYLQSEGETLGQRMQYAGMAFREFADMTGLTAPQTLPREDPLSLSCADGDGIFVLVDLMENDAGFIDLEIEMEADAEILIGWGEHLDDLRVRTFRDGRNFAARYHARAGRQRFCHLYQRSGLRYLQLFIQSHRIKLYYAGVRPTVYPVCEDVKFHTADALHQRIYQVSRRTLINCMHEHYEDCPWREQALYAMDSRNQMLFGYYAFGEYAFAKSSLRLMALSIRDDDFLEICSPARASITIPSFTAIYPVQLQEYLAFSGDEAFVREMLPVAERIGDMFMRHRDASGLIPALRDEQYWNFYEWQTLLEDAAAMPQDDLAARYDAPLQAFVALSLDRLALIEMRLGNADRSLHYREAADALKQALHTRFFDPQRGTYYSYCNGHAQWHTAELTQALAVYCGACPEDQLDRVLAHLASGELVPITLSHSVFQYDALMRRPERYSRWVFDHVAQVFGDMLCQNATTFWETEKGAWDFDNAGSLCHGWSAIPVYLYYAYALGARATNRGPSLDNLQPVDSGLYELNASFRLPDGSLRTLTK